MLSASTTLRRLFLGGCVIALTAGALPAAGQRPTDQDRVCNTPLPEPMTQIAVPGRTMRPKFTRDGCWLFMGVSQRTDVAGGTGILVMRRTPTTFEAVRIVPLPLPLGVLNGIPIGMALTPDDKVLVVSHSQRVTFIDAGKAMSGGDAILGHIDGSRIATSWGMAMTPDGKYALAAQTQTAALALIDVARARVSVDQSALLGVVPTSPNPISVAISPDGRYAYSASNFGPDVIDGPRKCERGVRAEGVVHVIDIKRAAENPAQGTISITPAGCGTQNLAVSPDGTRLSATAGGLRPPVLPEDSSVVLFDVRAIGDGKPPVRLGSIPMPVPPVEVADTGKVLFAVLWRPEMKPDDPSGNVLVIDPSRVGSGAAAILGRLPFVGTHLALTPDRRQLIAGGSGRISIVDVERLQSAMIAN